MLSSARRPASAGSACVELALCLPVLVGCFLAALDLSRAYRLQLALQDAVRSGAMVAASTSRSDAAQSVWEQRIKNAVAQRLQLISCGPHECEIDYAMVNGTAQIKVSTTLQFKLLVAWPTLPKQFEIAESLSINRFR